MGEKVALTEILLFLTVARKLCGCVNHTEKANGYGQFLFPLTGNDTHFMQKRGRTLSLSLSLSLISRCAVPEPSLHCASSAAGFIRNGTASPAAPPGIDNKSASSRDPDVILPWLRGSVNAHLEKDYREAGSRSASGQAVPVASGVAGEGARGGAGYTVGGGDDDEVSE